MREHSNRIPFRARTSGAVRNSRVRARWSFLLLVGVFTACSFSASYIRTYSGAPLPWKDVAVLISSLKNEPGSRVVTIDGEQPRQDMGFFELLPGRHRVEAGFSGQLYLYSEITSRGSVKLEMNAVAGRVYRLVTKPQLVNSALVYHIEDVTNAIWTSDGAPWDHFRKSLIQSYMADRRDSMPAEVMESELAAHEKQLRQSVQARIAENRPYLEQVAAEPGARKLSSGDIYFARTVGEGLSPKMVNTVKVQQQAQLVKNGTTDGSPVHSRTDEFLMRLAPECLQSALLQMRAGGKAKVVCPSEYGGPIWVLELELLEITK